MRKNKKLKKKELMVFIFAVFLLIIITTLLTHPLVTVWLKSISAPLFVILANQFVDSFLVIYEMISLGMMIGAVMVWLYFGVKGLIVFFYLLIIMFIVIKKFSLGGRGSRV